MKRVIFIVFVLPLSLFSQVTLDWLDFTSGVSIATDAFDNVYTITWDYNPAGDIYINKWDADGNFQWITSYNNTDNTRHEVATWVETDNENNIIVTGTIRSGFASPVNAASVIMKFDPDGNLLWRNVFESSFDGSSTRKCLIGADNSIYVLGMGTGPAGYVTKVKKFTSAGVAVWSYYDGAGIGAAQNFKFTPDNKILISGRGTIGSVNGYAKIDLDGNEIWNYPAVFSLTIGDAAGDNFGNTYLINNDYAGGSGGSILTKLSPTGAFIFDDLNSIAATKVEVGTDNYPVIAGFPNTGSFGLAFIKYDMAGTILWENSDADGPDYNLLLHAMMKLDPANNAYFAAGTLFEMAVCKVNADGTSGWLAHCSGGYANAFTFGNDYSIYVTGGSVAHFTQAPIITCDAPTGLFTNNISINKARVNWTPEPGAMQYEVWYKKVTAAGWKKKFVPGVNNKLNLKNLSCNTNYVWKIRTICDTAGVDLMSGFSSDQFFTTLTCREENDAPEDNRPDAITVYPNPAVDQFTILIPEMDQVHLQISDMNGKIMYQSDIQTNGISRETISTTNWPVGIYTVIISNADIFCSEKIMIIK